ncbi:hypothetical protein [Ekhidna sp.]
MFIVVTLFISISIIGNIIISNIQDHDYRDWINWSILIGPLSWPLQWYANVSD